MSTSGPFVDRETDELQVNQILTEAVPLLGLVVLFGVLGAVPTLVAASLGLCSVVRAALTVLGQLAFAVGVVSC